VDFPINNDFLMDFHRMVGSGSYHENYDYQSSYPMASDNELLVHYLYGGAGPFVDLLVYVDLGVGWTLKPVDFPDEEKGLDSKVLVEEEFVKRQFQTTMMQFATYYLVLGRSCLIKSYDKGGMFYFDEKSKITGLDCINPMTLTINSIQDVMNDTTGSKEFVQAHHGRKVSFNQDRVIYQTNNNFSRYSVQGISPLQRCITELRLLSRFPGYRQNLARKYSDLRRIIEVKTKEFKEAAIGEFYLKEMKKSKEYLNDLSNYYAAQEERGNNMSVYDWVNIKESSYAGKEVKLNDLELQTLRNIAFKLDVPLDLLMYSQIVNRSVMEVLADIFVNKQKSGARNYVYTPIIESIANEILSQQGITDGHLTVEYNPFLSKNIVETAAVIRDLWPTGSITVNEIRDKLDLPPIIDERDEEEA
jgi:hypothetical protein